jgi:hypothetical protein
LAKLNVNWEVPGSGFRPALARRHAAMQLFSYFTDLAFHHHILTCQVWARGSKVTTVAYCFQYQYQYKYKYKFGIPFIPHWVRWIYNQMKTRFFWYELPGFFNPERWTLNRST